MLKKTSKLISLSFATMSLTGCFDANKGFSDIENQMFALVNSDAIVVEPVPVIAERERFNYKPDSDRNVFEKLYIVDEKEVVVAEQEISGPNPFRVKEQLENFDIDEVKYIGLISTDKKTAVVIKDPNGISHMVSVGNYIGVNDGEIIEVNPRYILVNELLNNGNRWMNAVKKIYIYENNNRGEM